jgi:subfamily B ATP-binding cassette protein MsbA
VLFLFVAYALTVHRRLIQIGRQIARSGKVMACLQRIGVLLEGASQEDRTPVVEPLRTALRLEGVRLRSSRGHGNKPRLRDLDLALPAGARVAVVGKTGAGKSSLLRLLAGLEVPTRGRILWDDHDLSETNGRVYPRVGYLAQDPVFSRQRAWQLLGLANPTQSPDPQQEETLHRIGAWRVIRRWPYGLEEKVASAQLSRGERRALKLGTTLLGDASVWLLDDPLEGQSDKDAQRRLAEILARGAGRTIVVAFSRLVGLEQFDRVWALQKGRLVFDGTPAEWEQR